MVFQKGYVPTKEHRENLSKACKGRIITEETKTKISQANKGRLAGEKNPLYGVRRFGKDNPAWKGGVYYSKSGYVFVHSLGHPYRDKDNKVLRCRLLMEKHLGRYLNPKEIVHHKNGVKSDDRLENLKLFDSRNEHSRYHMNLRYGNV